MRTTLTESIKKQVAGRQSFKCANHPDSKLINYKCPLWARGGDNSGCFDESGYEIDHIKEHAISADNSLENLQALCSLCHKVKTKKFNQTFHTNKHAVFGRLLMGYNPKEKLYLCNSKNLEKNVSMWNYNRPPDDKRVKELSDYIKKNKRIDGIIYVAQLGDIYMCYDGNHRREACKLVKNSYPVLVELLLNPSHDELCNKFQALNSSVPISELYNDPNKYSDNTKLLVLQIVDRMCKTWPSHQVTSKNPRRPNFNKDLLETHLINIISDSSSNYNLDGFWGKLIEINEKYRTGKMSVNSCTVKMIEKCQTSGCYLFLKNQLDFSL